MAQRNSHTSTDSLDYAFDLSQIFIGRQQQLDFFEIYLNRWKKLIRNTNEESTRLTAAPSPYNKIPGLVVLLYGRGGFGKTTLLRRYRAIALQDKYKLSVSNVVDWEFAIEGKHSLFNLTEDQEVDPFEYFKILHNQLAFALSKSPKE